MWHRNPIKNGETHLSDYMQNIKKQRNGRLTTKWYQSFCCKSKQKEKSISEEWSNDTKIKQVQQLKYLRSVLTKDGKCDTEIRNTLRE